MEIVENVTQNVELWEIFTEPGGSTDFGHPEGVFQKVKLSTPLTSIIERITFIFVFLKLDGMSLGRII